MHDKKGLKGISKVIGGISIAASPRTWDIGGEDVPQLQNMHCGVD
jgi:hypothetical protein